MCDSKKKAQEPSTDLYGIDLTCLGTDADKQYGKMLGIGETPEERARHFANRSKQQ